jgi:hypothetical protein
MLASQTSDTYTVAIDGTTFTFYCWSYTTVANETWSRPFMFVDGATKISVLLMSTSTENRDIYWGVVGGASFTANVLVKQELVNGLSNFTAGDIINAVMTAANSSATKIFCFGWLLE